MARQSIEDLRLPPKKYRVDKYTEDPSGNIRLETAESAQLWDRRRCDDLRAIIASGVLSGKERREAQKLVAHYKLKGLGRAGPLSAASRIDMRQWRIRVSGWLWMLVADLNADKWVFFTVILPKWWVASSKLKHIVNRRPKRTPYRRAKGTPFVKQRDGYEGRTVRAGCGVGRA